MDYRFGLVGSISRFVHAHTDERGARHHTTRTGVVFRKRFLNRGSFGGVV
jgi:hypothetical protein